MKGSAWNSARGTPPLLLGVCASLAERLRVDVTLLRLTFLVLSLAWGLGVVLYVGSWLGMPHEGQSVPRLASVRGWLSAAWQRSERGDTWPRPLDRRWIGVMLLSAGIGTLLASFGLLGWITPGRALGLALTALGAATLVSLSRSK